MYVRVVVVTEIRYHLDREADPTDRSAVEQVVDHVNDEVKKLEALGIRVVRCLNPKSIDEMCDEFIELGKIVGAQERAEQIVAQVNADVADIRKLTADVSRKRVFVQIGSKLILRTIFGFRFTLDKKPLYGVKLFLKLLH